MLDDGRRLELLAALGIDVYRLRRNDAAPAPAPAATASAAVRLVVACSGAARRDARIAHRLGQALRAVAVDASEVAWVDAGVGGAVAELPAAQAYLMCGAAIARACSALLPIDRQQAATIAVSADPADWARDPSARRTLWQALKPLARRLREA
jgi:DNA polymerase III psi subunit